MALDVQQGFNLYADDVNKWLGLDKLKRPALEDVLVDFRPGGARVDTEVAMGIKKLAMPFTCKNVDTHLLGLFGLGAGVRKRFTAYGHVVDELTEETRQEIITVRGRLVKAEQADLKPNEMAEFDYAVGAIIYYHYVSGGRTVHRWNMATNELVINGVDQLAAQSANLAIRG